MRKPSSNFTGKAFVNKVADFTSPTMLPLTNEQRTNWQQANKAWWEATPMRYDWRDPLPFDEYTQEYYNEIDKRFLQSVWAFLPWKKYPFEQLIPYAELSSMDVLEIGVGQGTHAQLIAPHCRSFTGIDLTEAAVRATTERFRLSGISGCIYQMDAEATSFPNASFDYIWSWGVIHHSADTASILREMHRVLRPSGRACVMVYHRSLWNSLVVNGLLKGVIQRQWREHGTLHGLVQAGTDGAIARFYRPREWVRLNAGLFAVEAVRILGLKSEMIPFPAGNLKHVLEARIPDWFTRFATNNLKMGGFLVAQMRRVG